MEAVQFIGSFLSLRSQEGLGLPRMLAQVCVSDTLVIIANLRVLFTVCFSLLPCPRLHVPSLGASIPISNNYPSCTSISSLSASPGITIYVAGRFLHQIKLSYSQMLCIFCPFPAVPSITTFSNLFWFLHIRVESRGHCGRGSFSV